MTNMKVKLLASFYRMKLVEMKVEPIRSDEDMLQRAHWCCLQMHEMIDKDEREKAMRWLGWIQGVLCALKVYTVDDCRDHSRSDSPIWELNESKVQGK